jgi:hypothetical protein
MALFGKVDFSGTGAELERLGRVAHSLSIIADGCDIRGLKDFDSSMLHTRFLRRSLGNLIQALDPSVNRLPTFDLELELDAIESGEGSKLQGQECASLEFHFKIKTVGSVQNLFELLCQDA